MSLQRVSRAERFLENAVAQGKITESGRDFLIAALDPFHDTQLTELQGWPDLETSSSVVRCIKQTVTITSFIGGSSNWDAHIDLWPFMNSIPCIGTTERFENNFKTSSATTTKNYGGVTVFQTPAGDENVFAFQSDQISLSPDYADAPCRVVGVGFEIVNTTPEIYRGGQMLVYRQPNPTCAPTTATVKHVDGANAYVNNLTVAKFPRPPSSSTTAMLIPGTRTWSADQGCYVVGTFVGQENPPMQPAPLVPVILATATPDKPSSGTLTAASFNTGAAIIPKPFITGAYDGLQNAMYPSMMFSPLHGCGCKVMGLLPQATLQLTVNMYVEVFPNVSDLSILPLATPSAVFDPVALEIFSHALTQLPVGVPVDENGLGTWFADAIYTASKYLAPLADMSGIPGLGLAVRGAGAVAGHVKQHYLTPPSQTRPMISSQSIITTKKKKKNRQLKNQSQQQKKTLVRTAPARAKQKADNRRKNTGKR